jgi:hypothetical protein
MLDDSSTKRELLSKTELDYGHPSDNMQRTAALWASYLEMPITDYQVAMCMALVKIARSMETAKPDTYIDLAAYGAIAGQLTYRGERFICLT